MDHSMVTEGTAHSVSGTVDSPSKKFKCRW